MVGGSRLNKGRVYAGMVNWKVTAATIYCDAVDDEVTLLVYKDRSARCTGYKKYGKPNKEIAKIMERKSKQLKRQLECEGSECYRVIQYRDKLFAEGSKEEAAKNGKRKQREDKN